eukprot:1158610-Pelagomonas_calceolata.AAC.9
MGFFCFAGCPFLDALALSWGLELGPERPFSALALFSTKIKFMFILNGVRKPCNNLKKRILAPEFSTFELVVDTRCMEVQLGQLGAEHRQQAEPPLSI